MFEAELYSVQLLLLAALAATPDSQTPLLRAATSQSLAQFGACFAASQERSSAAWAFIPGETGGTFTNAGARRVSSAYWLAFREAKPLNQLQLFAGQDSSDLLAAVNRCR